MQKSPQALQVPPEPYQAGRVFFVHLPDGGEKHAGLKAEAPPVRKLALKAESLSMRCPAPVPQRVKSADGHGNPPFDQSHAPLSHCHAWAGG